MATYAVYVWSALAVFLLGLLWDHLSPHFSLRKLRAQTRRTEARMRARNNKVKQP